LKPKFEIDISPNASSSLEAHQVLARLVHDNCDHLSKNLRLPLGIYNVSVSRISEKLATFCRRLEVYFQASNELDVLHRMREVRSELIDYIELSIYAAAEHVDDIDSIATGFFKNNRACQNNAAYRQLHKEVQKHKKFIAASANAIKHQQSRIRLFSHEFVHAGVAGCLHGFFVEGVENGVIGPSSTFHKVQDVFSITTLAWEIILFVLNCSRELRTFLASVSTSFVGPVNVQSDTFSKAAIAAARLPLYTFGEEHPFARATVTIIESNNQSALDSNIYGSIRRGWSHSRDISIGKSACEFEGDGSSKSFRAVHPKTLSLSHWQ
jgi:hypothetical protein